MRRLTLSGEQLGAFERDGFSVPAFRSEAADDHVKVFPPPPGGGDPVLPAQGEGRLVWPGDHSVVHRDYTVRRVDLDAGEIDIDFVIHDGGVASAWASTAQVGDVLHVAGPRSSHHPPASDRVLLVGDETALPAIGRWIEEAPGSSAIVALVEVHDSEDEQPLARVEGELDLRYVHRSTGGDLLSQLRSLPDLGDVHVFVAGEHTMVKEARSHLLEERGLSIDQIRAVGYWRRGVSEHESHLAGHQIEELADLLTPHAVRTAATLRLADHVAAGADTPASLASAVDADPTTVAALVEHLADRGVFELSAEGRIGLTALGDALRDDHPSGARRRLDQASANSHMARAWAGLTATATGQGTGYETIFGQPFWDHVHGDPALAASFDGYMAEWAYQWVPAARDGHRWSEHGHIVDVGGGMGLLLAELLSVAPDAKGTVVELPATVASARWWLEHRGLADRATAVEGSFFDPLPPGDAVVLAQILHDWPDEQALQILTRAADAARASGDEGRVLLVERVTAAGDGPTGHAAITLLMRNLFGSTERTEAAYAELARSAGLEVVSDTPLVHGLHLLELRAR